MGCALATDGSMMASTVFPDKPVKITIPFPSGFIGHKAYFQAAKALIDKYEIMSYVPYKCLQLDNGDRIFFNATEDGEFE